MASILFPLPPPSDMIISMFVCMSYVGGSFHPILSHWFCFFFLRRSFCEGAEPLHTTAHNTTPTHKHTLLLRRSLLSPCRLPPLIQTQHFIHRVVALSVSVSVSVFVFARLFLLSRSLARSLSVVACLQNSQFFTAISYTPPPLPVPSATAVVRVRTVCLVAALFLWCGVYFFLFGALCVVCGVFSSY